MACVAIYFVTVNAFPYRSNSVKINKFHFSIKANLQLPRITNKNTNSWFSCKQKTGKVKMIQMEMGRKEDNEHHYLGENTKMKIIAMIHAMN